MFGLVHPYSQIFDELLKGGSIMRHWNSWIFGVIAAVFMVASADLQAQEEPEPAEEAEEDEDDPILEVGQDTTAIGGFVGYDFDEIDEGFVGADARVYFDFDDQISGLSLIANPAFNWYFISNGSMFQIDANALARLDFDTPVTPYAGIGLAINRWSVGDEADLSLTFNPLIVGGDFQVGDNLGGFIQLRGTRHSVGQPGFTATFTTFALMGGIHLRL